MSLLTKKQAGIHENASTQINVPEDVAAEIERIGRELIPDEHLAGEGRVEQPHVTVKYGVQPNEQVLQQAIAGYTSFPISLGKVVVFVAGSTGANAENNGIPVVIEVHGHELDALHDAVMQAMGTLPDDLPYVPHITVAYVKEAEAQHYAGNDAFVGLKFTATAVALSPYDDSKQVDVPLAKAAASPAQVVTPELPQVAPQVPQQEEEQDEEVQRDQPATDQPSVAPQQKQPKAPLLRKSPAKPKPYKAPKPPAENKNFKKWFGKSKVVDDSGKPLVVYHGTTHDIQTFDTSKATSEGYYGKAFYFTNDTTDLENYSSNAGPDITNRIEHRYEQLQNEIYDKEGEELEEILGPVEEGEDIDAKLKEKAKQELLGQSAGMSMPVYLSIQNPVYVQKKGGTYFNIEFNEETGDESGNGVDLYNAIHLVAGNFEDADVDTVWEGISGDMEFTAWDFEQQVRNTGGFTDSNTGDQASGEFIIQVYQELGFDGIILDAYGSAYFGPGAGGNMKMDYGTKHYVLWDANKIKSAIGNVGKYDPQNPNITAAVEDEEYVDEYTPESWEQMYTLQAGTTLYHGSSNEWDEGSELAFPAWFSTNKNVANWFAHRNGEGNPTIRTYKTTAPIELAELVDSRDIQGFRDMYQIEDGGDPNALAEGVCNAGFNGWIIPDNYRPGDDIMVCDGSSIQYVGINPADGQRDPNKWIAQGSVMKAASSFSVSNNLDSGGGLIVESDAGTIILNNVEDDSALFVEGIELNEGYEGKGEGQKLYDAAFKAAKKLGYEYVYSSNENNRTPEANKAWQRISQRYKVEDMGDSMRVKLAAGEKSVGDLGLARKIMHELMPVLGEANLPEPELKIVNSPRSGFLGQNVWGFGIDQVRGIYGAPNTTIHLQRSILNDENTLRRILAHELAHHADSLVNGPKLIEKWQGKDKIHYNMFKNEVHRLAHGKDWRAYAQKFNAKYGKDFVTEKSDESYVTEALPLKPYHILLKRDYDGTLAYEASSRISPKMKRHLDRMAQETDTEYRLTQTDDRDFYEGQLIGSFYYSRPKEEEKQKKLEELWAKAQKLLPSGAAKEQDDLLALMRERMKGPGWQNTRKHPAYQASLLKKAIPQIEQLEAPVSKDYDRVAYVYNQMYSAQKPSLNWKDFQKMFPREQNSPLFTQIRQNRPQITLADLDRWLEEYKEKQKEYQNYNLEHGTYRDKATSFRDVEQLVLRINQSASAAEIIGEDEMLQFFLQQAEQGSRQSGHPVGKNTVGWLRVDFVNDDWLLIDEVQSDLINAVELGMKFISFNSLKELMDSYKSETVKQKIRDMGATEQMFQHSKREFARRGYTMERFKEMKQSLTNLFKDWAEYGISSIIEIARRHGIKNVAIHTGTTIAKRDPDLEADKAVMYYDNLAKSFGFKKQQIDVGGVNGEFWTRTASKVPKLPKGWRVTLKKDKNGFYWGHIWDGMSFVGACPVGSEYQQKARDAAIDYAWQWSGQERPKTAGKRDEAVTSLTFGADIPDFPSPVLVRWEQGMRWREVLKVVKAIAGEIADKRVPWGSIHVWASLWKDRQSQDTGWEAEKSKGRVMYDVLHNGSYVRVDNVQPVAMGAEVDPVMQGQPPLEIDNVPVYASHKTPPLSDTRYNNPAQGEETNAYADIPERVRGTYDTPSLETLAPQMFEKEGTPEEDDFRMSGKTGPFYRIDTMRYDDVAAYHGKRFADKVKNGQKVTVYRAGKPNEQLTPGTFLSADKRMAQGWQHEGTEGFGGPIMYKYEVDPKDLIHVENFDASELVWKPRTTKQGGERGDVPEGTTFRTEVHDAPRGQIDAQAQAWLNGVMIGYVNFAVTEIDTELDDERYWRKQKDEYGADEWERIAEIPEQAWVKYVYVEPNYRRMGIATGMYEQIKKDYPGIKITSSGTTGEGGAMRQKMKERGMFASVLLQKKGQYAEGQAMTQHTDHTPVGMYKVLKSNPFADEIEALKQSEGQDIPELNPGLPTEGRHGEGQPQAKGEDRIGERLKQDSGNSLGNRTSSKRAGMVGPVYHGTSANFEQYESSKGLYYFTDSLDYAHKFLSRTNHGRTEPGANIRRAFLKMNNPFDARELPDQMDAGELWDAIGGEDGQRTISSKDSRVLPFWSWLREFSKQVKKELQRQGYDSIIQKETLYLSTGGSPNIQGLDNPASNAYVVFNPNQIKWSFGKAALKLRLNDDMTGGLKAALVEIEERFIKNPMNEKEYMVLNGDTPVAVFEVAGRNGKLRLKDIRSLEKGTGGGRAALQAVTAIADKHGVEMELTASPFGDEKTRLDKDQLQDWYRRHNFEDEPGHDPALGYMVRKPKKASNVISGEQVVDYVQKQHPSWSREQCYQIVGLDAGGDYILTPEYDLDRLEAGDDYDPSLAERYAKMKTPLPPIILDIDGNIRDGNHRVAAAKLRGDNYIAAYEPLDTYDPSETR